MCMCCAEVFLVVFRLSLGVFFVRALGISERSNRSVD